MQAVREGGRSSTEKGTMGQTRYLLGWATFPLVEHIQVKNVPLGLLDLNFPFQKKVKPCLSFTLSQLIL